MANGELDAMLSLPVGKAEAYVVEHPAANNRQLVGLQVVPPFESTKKLVQSPTAPRLEAS